MLFFAIKILAMSKYIYELPFKVRDYECDIQGIVNNSVYQNYLEHTRHEFILTEGISFTDLHTQGIDTVVARIQISYKTPLRSGDEFVSKLYLKKEGVKYVFYQDIFRLPDHVLCVRAVVETVATVDGKLAARCDVLDEVFGKYFD